MTADTYRRFMNLLGRVFVLMGTFAFFVAAATN